MFSRIWLCWIWNGVLCIVLITNYIMACYLDFVQLQYISLTFGFAFGPFKSLPQNFSLFRNSSKFQNFGFGDGKIWKSQYHFYLLIWADRVQHWKGKRNKNKKKWGSVTHQMAIPIPSISCCVLKHHNLFYQIHNALAFKQDMCCHLALCLQLLPFH